MEFGILFREVDLNFIGWNSDIDILERDVVIWFEFEGEEILLFLYLN